MRDLPNPDTNAVQLWLKSINRDDLHGAGWVQVNRQFHGVAMAMRPYLRHHFPDPAQQAAAFDGLVAGLMTLGHFHDIADLEKLFTTESTHQELQATP
jgi:hypothetical protein